MKKLENKTVLITGGTSGIGKACAIAAAHEGANVVVVDLKSENTDKAMAEIKKENPKAIFVDCDVSSFAHVYSAVETAVRTFGSLDVALNNAGIGGEQHKVGEMTEKAWLHVISVNLNGVFNCMKHELAQMAKQKSGVIINISSILGKVGFASTSHYVAAKHGVIGLTQTAAIEYAQEGIRINAICPGFIETPLVAAIGVKEHSELHNYVVDLHPMKRMGQPAEIAKGFIFLACDDSSFMTGSTLEIDGGYLAR